MNKYEIYKHKRRALRAMIPGGGIRNAKVKEDYYLYFASIPYRSGYCIVDVESLNPIGVIMHDRFFEVESSPYGLNYPRYNMLPAHDRTEIAYYYTQAALNIIPDRRDTVILRCPSSIADGVVNYLENNAYNIATRMVDIYGIVTITASRDITSNVFF